MRKIFNLSELKRKLSSLRNKGRKIVFTNGCFDIIHPGHIKILRKAKSLGDILIVGLNSDSSVKRLKGEHRPLLNQSARAEILSELQSVDFVVIFDETTPAKVIGQLLPDVLVKGGDYEIAKVVGREHAKKVVIIKLLKGHSTTNIIKKIKNAAGAR